MTTAAGAGATATSTRRAHVSDDVLLERYYRQQAQTMEAETARALAQADAARAAEQAAIAAEQAQLKAERAKQDAAEEAAARSRKRRPVKISDECWKNPLC